MGDNFVLCFSVMETNFDSLFSFVVLFCSLENFKNVSNWIFSHKKCTSIILSSIYRPRWATSLFSPHLAKKSPFSIHMRKIRRIQPYKKKNLVLSTLCQTSEGVVESGLHTLMRVSYVLASRFALPEWGKCLFNSCNCP